MSATPRTDAEARDGLGRPHHLVTASFARSLERELARYKRLEAILRDRADSDLYDGRPRMNAEMRVLVDWENS